MGEDLSDAAPQGGWLRGRIVGVTGGLGALGRCLLPQLAAAGAGRITVLDRHGAVPERIQALSPIDLVNGDVRDADACKRLAAGCEIVFHLAAQSHAGVAQENPAETIDVNVSGTARLMEACRRAGVRQVVFTSTGQVYGTAAGRDPLTEETVPMPHTIYGASKLAAEAIVTGYARAFGFSAVIARLANLYGPGNSSETVIGRAVRQAIQGVALTFTTLSPVRDFVTFMDTAEGLRRLAEAAEDHPGVHLVNIGSSRGTSIEEMAQLVAAVVHEEGLGMVPAIEEQCPPAKDPVPVLVLNPSRLRALTGWVPPTDLREGLRTVLRESAETSTRRI